MDERIADYLANADRFTALVTEVPDHAWSAPSPCAGWTAADVVDHVIETQRQFLEDRGLALDPLATGSPAQRWSAHDAATRVALADEAAVTATYDGYFGPTTIADTMRSFYGWDLVVHRWDLGRAVDRDVAWSADERAFVGGELATFGEALYAEGICRPPVEVAPEADEQTRILGLLGRRA